MRYIVHRPDGSRQFAPDAQRAADMAHPGDIEEDTHPGCAFPFVAWQRDDMGAMGTPFATMSEARAHLGKS